MTNDIFPARVVRVLDEGRIAINRGTEHGIYEGQTFLIYTLGEEIFDPETKESLGVLEITRGKGKADHVQEKIATVISTTFEIEEEIEPRRYNPFDSFNIFNSLVGNSKRVDNSKRKIIKHRMPFKTITKGDYVKPI